MIEPLEGPDRYRIEDVAAKVNEVISVVNRILGPEIIIITQHPGQPGLVTALPAQIDIPAEGQP